MFNYFKAFLGTHLGNEEGQGMVEYALILVFIALAVIATLTLMGTDISALFTKISTELKK